MTPSQALDQPVLVYTRIAQNRRRTVLLVAFSVIALVPFVVGVSYLASGGIVSQVRAFMQVSHARTRARLDSLEALSAIAPGSGDPRVAYLETLRAEFPAAERQAFDTDLAGYLRQRRAALVLQEAELPRMLLELMLLIGTAVTALLGLLFWAIAKSPTAKLLSAAGAWPARSADAEAARLLDNLAIGAGLPAPKLYVIETGAPNAFAAGMRPEDAVVVVTRGALNLLDRRELEGVLAHELSHIGNRDTRLNSIAASLALFLRLPYLLFRRELSAPRPVNCGTDEDTFREGVVFTESPAAARASFGLLDVLALPVALYVLVVAPLLGTLLRAAISREREFLADADAALLTRFPQGLMTALAKIGGAGSALPNSNPAFSHFYFADPAAAGGWVGGGLLATHPPLQQRILRLVALEGATAVPALEAAVREGKRYAAERAAHPPPAAAPAPAAADELDAFTRGNPMGRVFRVVAAAPVPLCDDIRPGIPPMVVAHILPGALIAAFDDPGVMREVITAAGRFGYIENSVELIPLDNVIPAEIYDPKLRAAIEARLPPLGATATRAEPRDATARSTALIASSIVIGAAFVLVLAVALLILWNVAG
jgi:heat shock protein HtpX